MRIYGPRVPIKWFSAKEPPSKSYSIPVCGHVATTSPSHSFTAKWLFQQTNRQHRTLCDAGDKILITQSKFTTGFSPKNIANPEHRSSELFNFWFLISTQCEYLFASQLSANAYTYPKTDTTEYPATKMIGIPT